MSLIRSKAEMYPLLARGELGNTIPQFFDLAKWEASPDYRRYPLWGVRSSRVARHPATRMFLPREEVRAYTEAHFEPGTFNVSVMVDAVAQVRAWLEVWEGPELEVSGVLRPPQGLSWREGMADTRLLRLWGGTAARLLLRGLLNEHSLEDLWETLERYQGHTVELSVLDRCFGTVPHRNAVIWEVRSY